MGALLRMLVGTGVAAVVLLTVADPAALAQSRFTDPGPQPPLPPCTCRADGRVFQLGEMTCLRTPQGSRMARCVMVINNPSWDAGAAPCPSARLPGEPGAGS
jgi:hypothetical protein